MSQLSLNQSVSGQATASSLPTQSADVLSVQSSNPKGSQQPGRNKKKGKNNRKVANKNDNETNDKKNNNNNARGDKKPKRKVKFPCKLCGDDHLTHLCPRMEDSLKFISQGLYVFTNPLPNNQNINSRTVDPGCMSS